MSYVTLPQLADKPGAVELAQVSTADHHAPVDPALMEATLREGDRSAWDAEALAIADDAKARIVEIVAEVDQTIDAHLRARVPVLPVFPVPSVLTRIARAFVRYELHKDIADEKHPIVRDYKDKRALLEAIRDGKVTLGEGDPNAADVAGGVHVTSRPRIFSRDSLGGL